MSLRNKLILSISLVGLILTFITVGIFLVLAKYSLEDDTEEAYTSIIKTFRFIQKTLMENAIDVVFELDNCKKNNVKNHIILKEEGILIGRVENCIFKGTFLREAIDITTELNELDWFIVYDREVLERFAENKTEFIDRFIKDRVVLEDIIVEGKFFPEFLAQLNTLEGYKLINFRKLIIDYPIVVEDTYPVARVIFIKDFTDMVKEILLTPVIFLIYSVLLVFILSTILFYIFSRIVRDITYLRKVTSMFKENDFSEIPKMSAMLRKEKTRDELYYLKRSILTMAQELEALISQLEAEKEKLEELAYTDTLTGLKNRRFFLEEAKRVIAEAERYGEPVSLMMLDIDFFKRINDEYGHDVGDEVLKKLAEVIRNNIRSSDIAARFGGEEFIILLPRTPADKAVIVAERIRQAFKRTKVLVDGKEVGTTVSIGIAEFKKGESIEELIKRADEALYEAKNTGKDKVVVAKDKEELQ